MRGNLSVSPWRIFLLALGVAFLAELSIMVMLAWLPGLPFLLEAIVDASLLSGVLFGFFWWIIFRPLRRSLAERDAAEREKEKIQAQLFHSEKLATIGTLAAGVAHEINNPLAIILGNVDALGDRLREQGGDPALLRFVDRQKVAGERITSIVRSLRTYARADTEHSEILDLHRVIEDTISLSEFILRQANITLAKELNSEKPFVRGNIGKLQQVFMNLVSNARDALEGAQREPRLEISTRDAGHWLEVRVSDNGSGVDPAVLPRMFDPFFTTKPSGKGTGLGLSICHSIIASFGGSISVSSDPGKGSSFIIRLPREQGVPSPTRQEAAPSPKMRGRVLVAEDEPEMRDLLTSCLREAGLEASDTTDGKTALQELNRNSYDVLITDIRMPVMGGEELIRRIRDSGRFPSLKIIVITGGIVTDFSREQRDFLRREAHGYLAKPFEKSELIALIARLRQG